VSREILLDAQARPEKRRDLIVRAAGYSAFFNALSRQTRNGIIGRAEQSLQGCCRTGRLSEYSHGGPETYRK
jgi:hypothetical protein